MKKERVLLKPDGSYVLVACESVGISKTYPHVKKMHGFTNNGFPINTPEPREEASIWSIFRSKAERLA